MTERRVTRTDLQASITADTGVHHRVIVTPTEAFRLEVESAFFLTGSSVFLPEVPALASDGVTEPVEFSNEDLWNAIAASHKQFAEAARTQPFDPEVDGDGQGAIEPGLPVILAALRFLEQHGEHRIVVAGHTDRSGSDALNDRLSDARARSVIALLEGDRNGFVKAAGEFPACAADGAMLRFAAHTRGWPCDPIDRDQPSARAISAFQSSYNTDFSKNIAADGVVGDQTRGAYFDVLEADLGDRAGGTDALAALRTHLRYVDPGQKFLACGERFPIENAAQDGFRSQLNRRVELLFFAPPGLPRLKDKAAADRIYAGRLFTLTLLDRRDLAASTSGKPAREPNVAIVDASPPPRGVGEPEDDLVTSMAQLQASEDFSDQYAFLEPFDQGFPAVGHQAKNDPPDDGPTALA